MVRKPLDSQNRRDRSEAYQGEIIAHFNKLSLDDFDMGSGDLPLATAWFDEQGYPPCLACVGAHLAMAMGVISYHREEHAYHNYVHGAYYFASKVFGQPLDKVIQILHRHGAPEDPFSLDPWHVHPSEVFRAAFAEIDL